MKDRPPVLFDLDGTVIDTVELIRESHRHAVRTVLGRDLSDRDLVANVGRPLRDQMRFFSEEHAEELFRVYREWNLAHTSRLVRNYPGMPELLSDLRAAGHELAIVTSKSARIADLAFDILPLRDNFATVIASEDTERHKPDPAPVLLALERLGAPAEAATMVGDSPFDLQSGLAAGTRTIGVTWGFFDRDRLEAVGPDAVVDGVDELRAHLLGS